MLTINKPEQLVEFFNGFKSPGRAIITSKTSVKMNKRDVLSKTIPNPFGPLFKIQTMECLVNMNYEDLVNDVRLFEEKTTDFKANERAWGEHINGVIVKHDDKLYAQCIPDRVLTVHYEREDGTIIEREEFDAFMPKVKEAFKDVSRQETSVKVDVRNFKLESIKSMVIENTIRFEVAA